MNQGAGLLKIGQFSWKSYVYHPSVLNRVMHHVNDSPFYIILFYSSYKKSYSFWQCVFLFLKGFIMSFPKDSVKKNVFLKIKPAFSRKI